MIEDLSDILSQNTQEALITAFKDGYEPSCEIYDELVGRNNKTFGFDLHFTIRQALIDISSKFPDVVQILKNEGRFELLVENKVTSFYRIGKNLKFDKSKAFPMNPNAGLLSQQGKQMSLEIDEDTPERNYNYVLGHVGNQYDGLLGLYLCEVEETQSGKITKWKNMYCLWAQDNIETSAENTALDKNKFIADDINIIKDETVIKIKEEPSEKRS